MKKGENSLFTIPPELAYGESGERYECYFVHTFISFYYKVELVSFVKDKESWDMETPEKIEATGKKKEEGNALFRAGKYAKASKRYEKAIKFIEYDTNFSIEEKKSTKDLKIA
ncbi:hypothetical protein AAHE18_11G131700 [Arachis hypogaea]